MPSLPTRCFAFALLLTLGFSGASAQSSRDQGKDAKDSRPAASRSAKGPLPDPALLDGSAVEAEKRSDYGMLGEFEMPGDENAKSDRVGGGQQQPPPQGGGGAQQSADPTKSGGGGGPSSPDASQASAGGGVASSSENQPQGGGQQSGGAGGQQSANAQAQSAQGGGAAEGQQVGQMGGSSSGGTGQSSAASKPQQVALGDSAMQIKPQSGGTAPNVVGAQPLPAGKDVPQAYDAKTPSGGRQSAGGGGNQGVEKGRVMPSGI